MTKIKYVSMGLGPGGKTLLGRVGVERIEQRTLESLRTEITLLQQARSLARALAQMKRREASGPRPRRHKNHCPCHEDKSCCRCTGVKCVKTKPNKRARSKKS